MAGLVSNAFAWQAANVVSANEIIAELQKLEREELERVDARLRQLLDRAKRSATPRQKPIGQVLLEFAGKAQGLPADYSTNLDHYLYGIEKQQP